VASALPERRDERFAEYSPCHLHDVTGELCETWHPAMDTP
jgi:hypothetical protein